MKLHDITHPLSALGALPVHTERILRHWVQARALDGARNKNEHFLPAAVRAQLPTLWENLQGLVTLRSSHLGDDNSVRLLLGLNDGQTVETVLLPRGGVCVSSQVGCAVGCVFCMTGKDGLIRQVGSAEIVAQVALARQQRPVNKVVFMGMGEPAHNLDNVMEAIELLGTLGNIGHKNLVFSTVGDLRVFEELPRGHVKPALALSLHTTRAGLREQLLPRAPRLSPEELMDHAEVYARTTDYPVQVQWTLIEGVNDSDEELDGIVRLFKGKYAILNMIPYNAVDGLAWRRPPMERCAQIARSLHQRGVLTKLRQSAGQDVEGGCGQLRAREALGRVRIPIRPAA
jgi:23S rRNA (adenine2503-C2)-methyltransferase